MSGRSGEFVLHYIAQDEPIPVNTDRGNHARDAVTINCPEYGRAFRRRLGIDSEQALDLFHQTVSMKAVESLNDFVRSHTTPTTRGFAPSGLTRSATTNTSRYARPTRCSWHRTGR